MHNLSLIFSNTIRLLRRDRTFQIFSVCSILLVGFIQSWAQFFGDGNFSILDYANMSGITHLNACLFGPLATQALIVLSMGIYRKDEKKTNP